MIVVLDENQNLSDINEKTQIISIIMPNNLSDGSKPTNKTKLCNESLAQQQISRSTEDWMQYQVSIGEIEKAAGHTDVRTPGNFTSCLEVTAKARLTVVWRA